MDGLLLVDLWPELVVPWAVQTAWQPVVDAAIGSGDASVTEAESASLPTAPPTRPPPAPAGQHLSTLTARERDVLARLPILMTVEEIASALHISPNTVRRHQKAIYRKLGVTTRRAAVRAARSRKLLDTTIGGRFLDTGLTGV